MNNVSIEQLAPNFTKVWFNGTGWIAFSYRTPIAFAINGKFAIRQNDWATTTGKHLNAINDDKSIRINSEAFNEALASVKLSFL